MDISVIIANYNTKAETFDCIKSCLLEGSKVKVEIIVIDNGSIDGSAAFFKKNFGKFKNVSILENKSNLGFSKAVNRGLRKSSGKYKYLLNSDTKVPKNIFSKLMKFAEENPKAGVIGTKLVLPDGSTQRSCFNFPTILGAIKEYWLGEKGGYSPFYKDKVAEVDAVVGASFLITPAGYEKAGTFDEKYFMFYEDLDYCRKIKKAGLNVYYFPGVAVFHYHGLSGKTEKSGAEQWKRLIPSSISYHGLTRHHIINFILWSGQKLKLGAKNM